MKISTFHGLLLTTLVASVSGSLTCQKLENGLYLFQNSGTEYTPGLFDCMKVTIEESFTMKVKLLDTGSSPKTCSAAQIAGTKSKVKYEKVEVPTGIKCTHECKEEPGQHRCTSKPVENICPCALKGLHVIVKPVSSEIGTGALVGGQNDASKSGEEETCEGKEEGFQFPDPVTCVSMTADVTKRRVYYKPDEPGKCRYVVAMKKEKKYVESVSDDVPLQGCIRVCKMAGPRCEQTISGTECLCKSPGLTKQLVPLDLESVTTRLVQTKCEEGQCGPCGRCGEDKVCVLRENAHVGNVCPCGEICPSQDNRRSNLGGQIGCEPNLRLECMAKPAWLGTSNRAAYKPGEVFPDMCFDGEEDRLDTCGCAPDFEETPGEGATILCKKSKK